MISVAPSASWPSQTLGKGAASPAPPLLPSPLPPPLPSSSGAHSGGSTVQVHTLNVAQTFGWLIDMLSAACSRTCCTTGASSACSNTLTATSAP